MLTYWLMYIIPSSMALFMSRLRQANLLPWILIGFFFIMIIGLRYRVGGDWANYLHHYNRMDGITLIEALSGGDPAHQFINWLMYMLDWGVYGINVIYGTVFMVGLIKFSRGQTYPWLSMAVAVPYLITVVVMGYSRQAMAIGLFLLAITYLQKKAFKTYIVLILIAALFHKTAILLLPLGVFLYGKGIILRILMIIPVAYGAWGLLLSKQQEELWNVYVEANMQSEGAIIRVLMNLIPSLLLLIYKKEWKRSFNDYSFWFWIAMGSIISVALVNVASTAIDRIALYFIPIQLVVYTRLPYLARNQIYPSITKVIILLGYTAVLFVWLNFAVHARLWLPYQNILFQDLF